jgi:hypothetical protein
MTNTPRRRVQMNGVYVIFESRNHKLALRLHPCFKQRHRMKANALERM